MENNQTYFGREMRIGKLSLKNSLLRILIYGVSIGLVTFVLHFTLLILYDTVVSRVFSEIMGKSYFSVLYLCVFVSFTFFFFYFLINKRRTFSCIKDNKWYVFIKSGYSAKKMAASRIAANALLVWITYTSAFLVSSLISAMLGYKFMPLSIINLYLYGLRDIFFMVSFILLMSVFIHKKGYFRLAAATGIALMIFLRVITGYGNIVSVEAIMTQYINLLKSPYYILLFFLIIAMTATIIICAGFTSNSCYAGINELGINYVVKDYRDGTYRLRCKREALSKRRGCRVAVNALMWLIVSVALAVNIFLVTITMSNSTGGAFLGGNIPYLFDSHTMSPYIEKSDLAFFKKISDGDEIKTGDIVMVTVEGELFIQMVMTKNGEIYVTDIVNYPTGYEPESVRHVLKRENITARFTGSKSWLGAFVVLCNSFPGRILFLIVPILWLFFGSAVNKKLFGAKAVKAGECDDDSSLSCVPCRKLHKSDLNKLKEVKFDEANLIYGFDKLDSKTHEDEDESIKAEEIL